MRKAKVKALSVGGRGNKIFSSGDTVTENNFPPGNFDLLIEQKFIEEILEEKKPEVPADDTGGAGGKKSGQKK